jgi:outer membrane protein
MNTAGFDEDVILGQVIELGKRGSRVRGAKADVAAAQFDRAGLGTDLEFALRSAYFDALRADVERDLANDALKSALLFQNAARIQLAAGDVPRANVVRSSIEVSRARAALEAAQNDRRIRYSAIRSLLALPDEAPIQLGDRLGFSPRTFDLVALQELATRQRADLQSARATLRSRQAGVQSARALGRPDAFVEARHTAIAPYPNTPNGTSLRVGVVIPLLDFGRNRAGVAEARAGIIEQQGTLDQTTRSARLDVATTFERFVAAQRAVQSFDAGRLAQSRELLDMAQIGYERGANSYLELIDAQTVYRAEQAGYARALAAWNTSLADLQRAVGGQLP